LKLIETQVETLYQVDKAGRLLCVNEEGTPTAALFFLGRTAEGNIWRFRHDIPQGVQTAVDALCRSEPVSADFSRPPQHQQAIKRLISSYRPVQSEWHGPAYTFPDPFTINGSARLIDEPNRDLFSGEFAWLNESWSWIQPCAVMVEQAQIVSICFSSRNTLQAAEAGLETLPDFRRRGYAAAVVSRWAQAVRDSGRRPLYSTSWENVASQGVAAKLGLIRYGDDWSLSE
jgi:RimJ/RimL family protein N-acetyltransferase